MTMNVSRLGQIGGAGDNRALFQKLFAGEVLTTFNTKCVMSNLTRTRNITSGKSASFPVIGRTKASYHTAGTRITGKQILKGEKILTIDDLLISDSFINNIDEAMAHYEFRSEYTRQQGDALAQTYDRNLLSLAVLATTQTTGNGIGVGGVGQGNATSVNIGATPTINDIVDAAYDSAAHFDESNIPEDERYLIVDPRTYYKLVRADKLVDTDVSQGNGDYAKGVIRTVAGFSIVKSNNLKINHTLPANIENAPDYQNKYQVDASKCVGLFLQKQALGTVKLLDLATESDYMIDYQGTLTISKMAVGHGVLRPECLRTINAVAP